MMNVRVKTEFILEFVGFVYAVGVDRNDLSGSASEIDHAAVANDELAIRTAIARLAIAEGQQVAVPQGAAGLQSKLRALQHCAEERFLIALHQRRNLAAFGHHDTCQSFGSHALGQSKRHLRLEGLAAHDVEHGAGLVGGGHGRGASLSRRNGAL